MTDYKLIINDPLHKAAAAIQSFAEAQPIPFIAAPKTPGNVPYSTITKMCARRMALIAPALDAPTLTEIISIYHTPMSSGEYKNTTALRITGDTLAHFKTIADTLYKHTGMTVVYSKGLQANRPLITVVSIAWVYENLGDLARIWASALLTK